MIKLRWALFVTYTIIQSITSSEMCALHLTHPSVHTHTWSSGHTHTHLVQWTHTHTHTWSSGHTHTHTWSSGHTHTHTLGAVDTHTHTHTHTLGAVDTHTHTHLEQWTHTHLEQWTHTHTHTHTWSSGHTHTWNSGQPTLQRPGSSRRFGALLKGLTSVVDNSCRSRDSNPQPRVTSPTLYPLGHDCPHQWRLHPFHMQTQSKDFNFYFEVAMCNKSHRNRLIYYPVLV